MAIVTTVNVLRDDAEVRMVEEVYTDDQTGQVVGRGYPDPEWKAGTPAANEAAVREALMAARATLKAGIDAARADRQAWPTMTANQKDRATRDALDREVERGRVLLDLVKVVMRQFDTGPEA